MIAVNPQQRERQDLGDVLQRRDDPLAGLVWHRPVLRPASGDVGHRQRVGVLTDRVASFMADQVDLHKPGRRAVPLRPGPDRDCVLEQRPRLGVAAPPQPQPIPVRRLAPDRDGLRLRGRSHTKPGSLLKDAIPIRTWAQWDGAAPGFVEIDLVGHEGGNAVGEHAYTLTVTDIATGWTENRSVPNKARKWVIAALADIAKVLPFPLLGIDSDNGSELINHHLLAWCEQRKLTFTRSRSGNSNDGAHVE